MIDPETKRRVKVPRTKKYKRLRTVALFNIVLLVLNIFSYFWVSGPGVLKTQAVTSVIVDFTICPAAGCPIDEDEDEDEDEPVITLGAGPVISPLTTPLGLISPEELARLLIPGEADIPFYNSIYQITAPDIPTIPIVPGQMPIYPYTTHYLTFWGKTNIKDAIVIFTLTSPEHVYATTRADPGTWSWTVPQILSPGQHFLTVLAMSPTNAAVRETFVFEFFIQAPPEKPIPPTAEAPPEGPEEISEILPPIELPPIEITKDIYVLDLEIIAEEEVIQPGREISLVTDVTSFDPTVEEEITLTFNITDQSGRVIFDDVDLITLKDSASVIKRIRLAETVEPGNYIATVKLTKKDITYLTSVGFIVQPAEKEVLVLLPGRITVSQVKAQGGLFTSFVFLSFLMILFIILLWREYQRAKREIQITGRDLWQDGQIA